MIEDNATNLQLMVYLLAAFGHEPVQALDGAEGVELARRQKLDLILLDIHMPQMDGYEVVRRLKNDRDCREIPIVAVTALAMVGDREKILASGFSGYIAKPIDPEAFLAQVQAYLGNAHTTSVPPPTNWQQEGPPETTSPVRKFAVVLFVDNMQSNIDLVRSVMEPSGYEVYAALSAKDGLDLARRVKPDLILSDVHMPHEDGYSFMRMVQSDPLLRPIPFVFLTASVWSTREKVQALAQGATKFLSRPIEPQALLEEIEDCLRKRAET